MMRFYLSIAPALLLAGAAGAQETRPVRPVHTYSIVAVDSATGEIGAAGLFGAGVNLVLLAAVIATYAVHRHRKRTTVERWRPRIALLAEQLGAADAVGKPRVVLHLGGGGELTTRW